MAKIPIRKVESKLPHARLYLDDVQEIEELYRGAFKEIKSGGGCDFYYEIKGEMKFETLKDLEEHGGQASSLDMYMTLTDSEGYNEGRTAILRMSG